MKYKLLSILLAFLIISLCTGTGWSRSIDVPITLQERAGINWRDYPITIGFPVPKGNKEYAIPPRVVDAWNNEVPSQAVLAGKWPQDGSPRWWLITFLGSVSKGNSTQYRIVPGEKREITFKRQVNLTQEGDRVILENGLLRVEIAPNEQLLGKIWFDHSGRVSNAERDLAQEEAGLFLKTASGLFRGKNSQIMIVESGRVRTVVSIKGVFYHTETQQSNGFSYEGQLVFYGDSPFINLQLTLVNQEVTDWTRVDGAWICFQQKQRQDQSWEGAFGCGTQGAAEVKLNFEEKASLIILGPEKISWEGKSVTRVQLKKLNTVNFGWVDLTGSSFGMTIGVSNCWQQYPKALEISGLAQINIELVPKASPVLWGRGVAKTHDLTILFHSARDREYTERIKGLLNAVPVASLPAVWYNQAGVFYNPLRIHSSAYVEEKMIASTYLGEKSKGDFLNLYGPGSFGDEINQENWGIFNYGDIRRDFSAPWAVKGEYWNNNQYDLPLLLLREFLETTDAVFLDIAKASLRHVSDVDLAHPSAADRVTPGLDHIRSARTGLLVEAEDFSHVKNQGLLLGYYLLGDYRLLNMAVKVANRICLIDGLDLDRPRSYGLGIIGSLTGYEATGEERYLLRAREIGAALVDVVEQNKGILPSDFTYQTGLAIEGLLQLSHWDNNPELMKTVKTVVDRVIYDFWDEENGYLQDMGGLTFTSILCRLYEQTGNEKYRNVCQTQFGKFLNSTEILKPRDVALSYRNLYSFFTMEGKQKKQETPE